MSDVHVEHASSEIWGSHTSLAWQKVFEKWGCQIFRGNYIFWNFVPGGPIL